MDELAAAAAVVAMPIHDFAEGGFEQRPPGGDANGREGRGLTVEDTEANKESNTGDAASGEGEDATEQVSGARKVPCNLP